MDENNNVNVLIADDNESNLILLQEMLKTEGYYVVSVNSGEKALEEVDRRSFDVILLDIMMPVMDGFQVCKKLKDGEHKNVPVIFLTAKSDTGDVVNGFKIGGADYIRKPFQRDELIARVKNQVRLKLMNDHLMRNAELYKESRDELMIKLFSLGKYGYNK
ncbi:MAG: response regulator [Marinilabiliaceae bacterium]|nr:response regulator [Marinilabiliaceae bacterium]